MPTNKTVFSSPDLTSSPEFRNLAKLGLKSIPLVVEKLTQPKDFFATSLCNLPRQISLNIRLELTLALFL